METLRILDVLVGHPTLSRTSNLPLVGWVAARLAQAGARVTRLPGAADRENLFASVGPDTGGGVVLSGHCDVVPVSGQDWTRPPFALTVADGRAYGRGTADMKGFLACAIAAMEAASRRPLRAPLHLAMSFDEEIGCLGVRGMLGHLRAHSFRARACIVGEPTSLDVVVGHKGKTSIHAVSTGMSGHSSLAPASVNAIHVAADAIGRIRARQDELAADGARDAGYEIPYTTLHVGQICGGVALNVVPNRCSFEMEIRNLAGDDPGAILRDLRRSLEAAAHPGGFGTGLEVWNEYPALDTAPDAPASLLALSVAPSAVCRKVSFGTEAGLFARDLGIGTVVCGPGRIAQAHQPDEYVCVDQLRACDAMLDRLISRLEQD